MAIPTVKSFCGCCDLKVACIAIASFRLVVFIIAFIAILMYLLLFGFVFSQIDEESPELQSDSDKEMMAVIAVLVLIWLIILIPIILINIIFSYWFIRGATSKDPNKMKYYVYMEAVNVCMLVLPFLLFFNLRYFVSALFECYVAICAYSLYKESMNSSHDDAENTVIRFENIPAPPPQYSSCEKDMNVPNTGAYPKLNP